MISKSLNNFYISAFLKSQTLLLPILFLFYLDNGLTLSDYFLFQGIIVIINVFLQIPIGILSNFVSRKNLIIFSYIIYLGRIILWLLAKGFYIVLFGEIFYAVSKAIFDSIEAPYIYEVLQKKKQENNMLKNYSKLNFALCTGAAFASILGTTLYKYSNIYLLLVLEFIIITCACIFAFFIPNTHQNFKNNFSFKRFKYAGLYILKTKQYIIPILYSGLLTAFSHFFFWSFQPLMKLSFVPILFFGIILFCNNIIRAFCSYYTSFISKYFSLLFHGILSFVINVVAFLIFIILFKLQYNSYICILFIFYLCIAIAAQLTFTIRQATYLQNKSLNRLRGYVASVNVFIIKLFIGIILILPKYIKNDFSLEFIYLIYFGVFVIIGIILLLQFYNILKKYEKKFIINKFNN